MWMNYYVLGSGKKFAWRDVLKSVEEEKAAADTAKKAASQ
jgi:hypothetical protein